MRPNLPAIALLFVSFCAPIQASDPQLPKDLSDSFHSSKTAEMIPSLKQLPAPVTQALAKHLGAGKLIMAEPGEKFQATDVIMEPNLPGRRLVWAARVPGCYLLHYESGGIAHMFHFAVIGDGQREQPRVIWAASYSRKVGSMHDFLELLDSGKLLPEQK